MLLEIGQTYAQFKVVRKIGEGGMGEVYLAEDTKLSRKVALKVLRADFLDNEDRRNRFDREARTAAQISHANVMAIYDLDKIAPEAGGRELTYIVMEFVEGLSLSEYLRQHSPGLSDTLRLVQKIASGLAAAHKLNIVHRDIKLDNIIVDSAGEPKILDFGLAKPIETGLETGDEGSTDTMSQELTQEGKILGTISYMSPEQARGEKVDARSDVFSFGILLYGIFTGKSPFEGPDRVSVLAKILEGRQVPLRQLNQAAPAELERIVDKCLQKNANDRYQSTHDLVVDLRSLRRQYDSGVSDSTSITSESIAYTGPNKRRWGRTLAWWVGGFAVFALAVIFGMVYLVGQFGSGAGPAGLDGSDWADLENLNENIAKTLQEAGLEMPAGAFNIPAHAVRENALAILGFENKTGDSEMDWLSDGLPEILLTDLSQGGAVNVIGRTRVLDCLGGATAHDREHSHESMVRAARSLGASRVMTGSYFRMGKNIRIDARLEDTESGDIVLAHKVVGEDPMILVDSLTTKLAESLDMIEYTPGSTDVASITSKSPEAFKQYLLGMEQFQLGRLEESIELFEKAIDLDTSFALPYMRIGMGYGMQGNTQKGAEWLAQAYERRDRLPIRPKLLLDAYADIWFNRQFDDAMLKMKSYLEQYPDDQEVRAFYGILLHQLAQKPDEALAQLDTAAMFDETDYWVLTFYDAVYRQTEQFDKAIAANAVLKHYYPDHPDAYLNMADIYLAQDRYDEAAAECTALLAQKPDNKAAARRLILISFLLGDIDRAEEQTEHLLAIEPDDDVNIVAYCRRMANINVWRGRFGAAKEYYQKAIEAALRTGDSSRICDAYRELSSTYYSYRVMDSALHYSTISYSWASHFDGFAHAMILVNIDRTRAAEAREMFNEAANSFRSRVPQELWPVVDDLEMIFDGICAADTASTIEGFGRFVASPTFGSSSDRFLMGRLLTLTGKHREAVDALIPLQEGGDRATDGIIYVLSHYYAGVAEDELGNSDEAKRHFSEMLRWWADPDIVLEEIADARARLARLTS